MFNSEEYFDDVLSYIRNGKIDKQNAPLTWFRLTSEFNLPTSIFPVNPNHSIFVNDIPHWSLVEGDIIAFGSIEFQDTDKNIKRSNIVVKGDGDEIQFISNSRKFFDINQKIFQNITLQIQRDKKINQLL